MFQLSGDGKEKKPSYNSPFDTPIKPAAALRNQGRRFSLPSAGSAAHEGSRHADILSRDYELEQTNLTNLVEYLRQEVKEQEKQKVNVRQFIAAVRKYTDMQQLDASVLREFVEKIYISEVYTPDENEPRIKVREIEIVYNFIGAFDFEDAREQSQAAQKENRRSLNYADSLT